jgi:hypothetical protein
MTKRDPSSKLCPLRQEQLRIQALGAAISRRDWHATERAYEAIRDHYDRPPRSSRRADGAVGERAPPAICPFCAAKPGELHHDNCGLKAARDVT